MGELKGFIFSLLLYVVFFLPFQIFLGIQSIHQNAFMKVTTEVQQMVDSEGGVTPRIQGVVNKLHAKGYDVTFKDQKGSSISGKQPVGTVIEIQYNYKYVNVYREEKLNTSNYVSVMRR
ncbi:hypothetical protein FOL75_04920 [Bacillus thuringiensis]|uniref:hypothetical protein n=1 Tax=Bacillus thuringiensis TaxID=1428 RepID=UPI002853B69B|nr:hypothetical protein [Bacillus thuringiensis]MDR5021411.1 hypothetical protein [Bacillus thuringiensis]